MSDRYQIISRDWQRFDRAYVVVDTALDPLGVDGSVVLQTNNFNRAVQVRDELNTTEEWKPWPTD